MLWVLFAVLCLGVVALLLVPFLKATTDLRRRADYDIVVYRSQLAEIETEIEEGLLTPDQAEAARAEVHRRMLAAEDAELERPLRQPSGMSRYARTAAAVGIGLVVPLGALAMYAAIGHPSLPGKPYLWRVHNDPEFAVAASADALASAVEANPTADGYAQLGQTLFAGRQYEQAAAAYRRAFELGTNDPASWSEFAEAVTVTNDGAVVPEAMGAFLKAYALEPRSERSRFYLGLAEAQIGKLREAVAIWRDLEKSTPPDARWLPMLREHIAIFAKQGGFDPASVPPSPPDVKALSAGMSAMAHGMPATPPAATAPAASAADVARDPTVQAMVQRLADRMAQNPNDVEGWQRLAHAYVVLGQAAKARVAADHAVKLKPNDTASLLALAEAQKAAAPDVELPPDFLVTMRKVLAVDGNSPPALYYMGLSEAAAGRSDTAKAMWNKALKTVPPGDPLAMEIHHRLAGVTITKK